MRRRLTPTIALAAALIAAALALALRGDALAQQTPRLTSTRVEAVPTDPDSAIWQQTRAVVVPLTPQLVALPRLPQVSVSTVDVRSVNDGERIAFRLEWADPTRDARATRLGEFRDAAAVMVAVAEGLPNICMGMPGQLTNLWHWKADWQEDIDKGVFHEVVDAYPNFYKDAYPFVNVTTAAPPFRYPNDFASPEARQYTVGLAAGNPLSQTERPSPVEELLSVGFGTATHKAQQAVQGKGVWSEDRWRVVFTRALGASDPDSASLAGRAEAPFAFAVWNGSNQEVGARKQLSSFVTVRIEAPGPPLPPLPPVPPRPVPEVNNWPLYLLGLAIVLILVGVSVAGWWGRKREIERLRGRTA